METRREGATSHLAKTSVFGGKIGTNHQIIADVIMTLSDVIKKRHISKGRRRYRETENMKEAERERESRER